MFQNRITALLALSVSLAASNALAGAWSPAAGANTSFAYSNGQDANGLFGNPAVGGDKFFFTPSAFEAVSPGVPASNSDLTSVIIHANPGLSLDTVSARIEGDFSFLGSPAQIDYSGTLTVDYGAGPINTPLVFVPTSPQTSGNGTFIGTALFDIPNFHNAATVLLSGSLLATSSSGATAFIQIKNAEIGATTLVPEPASLGVLVLGAAALLRRSRKTQTLS